MGVGSLPPSKRNISHSLGKMFEISYEFQNTSTHQSHRATHRHHNPRITPPARPSPLLSPVSIDAPCKIYQQINHILNMEYNPFWGFLKKKKHFCLERRAPCIYIYISVFFVNSLYDSIVLFNRCQAYHLIETVFCNGLVSEENRFEYYL